MFQLSNEASSSINLKIYAGNIVNVSQTVSSNAEDCCASFIHMHLLFQQDKVRRKKKCSHLCMKMLPEFLNCKLTGFNNGGHRRALHIIFNSHNTDVVLNTWNEVV